MRESEIWSQDAVLAAMLNDIRRRVFEGIVFDFVLATGDLAFSGQETQYTLVEAFIDDLVAAIGLTRDKIFCVPGNHDVDRGRQTKCFAGARSTLQNESDIYSFLSSKEERETLLARQRGFQEFQERCFPTQVRHRTSDGLGYVSIIDVDEIRVAIIGLNSAWLAEGGALDHGRLLLGECQVTNGIEIVRQMDPQIVIGMAHHPFALLSEFDRLPTQRRIENTCHYFHCGHLHVPEASNVRTHYGRRCLTLAAGASFESRTAHNAYTVVTLDLLHAQTDVTFVRYEPTNGEFAFNSDLSYPHQIDAAATCDIDELAAALDTCCPTISDFSYYLAALLVEWAAEVPVPANGDVVFGTVSLLRQQPDSELKSATIEFFTVSNAVKLLYGRKPLEEIIAANSQPVARYGAALLDLSNIDTSLHAELVKRNESACMLAGVEAKTPFSHTLALLEELRDAAEWDRLRQQAERHIGLEDQVAAAHVKRMLALCLARSTERVDRNRALRLYQELADSPHKEAVDLASIAIMLSDDGNYESAAATVLHGVEVFPQSAASFVEIGMKIVESTGDLNLRGQLMAHKAESKVG